MSEPAKYVKTAVQEVWEILDTDGDIYTFVDHRTAPTPGDAIAFARKRVATMAIMDERYGPIEPPWKTPTLASVRRRTTVTVELLTTEYADEQSIEEVETADA